MIPHVAHSGCHILAVWSGQTLFFLQTFACIVETIIQLPSLLSIVILYSLLQKGFTFDKVSDLIAAKTTPKAVRAMKAWKGSSPDNNIEKNELLIIKEVKSKLKKKVLKVYSLAAGKRKELPESCVGKFSTRPYDVRLYLPEIIEHLDDPFPMQAMLYVNAETAHDLPNFMCSSVITMKKTSIETTLVATGIIPGEELDRSQLVDIPYDLDIEVQIIKPKDEEDRELLQLHDYTKQIFEQFNPSQLCPYLDASNSDTYDAQAAFFTIVREGNELTGEITTSTCL